MLKQLFLGKNLQRSAKDGVVKALLNMFLNLNAQDNNNKRMKEQKSLLAILKQFAITSKPLI